jgi:hypothetical protein
MKLNIVFKNISKKNTNEKASILKYKNTWINKVMLIYETNQPIPKFRILGTSVIL